MMENIFSLGEPAERINLHVITITREDTGDGFEWTVRSRLNDWGDIDFIIDADPLADFIDGQEDELIKALNGRLCADFLYRLIDDNYYTEYGTEYGYILELIGEIDLFAVLKQQANP